MESEGSGGDSGNDSDAEGFMGQLMQSVYKVGASFTCCAMQAMSEPLCHAQVNSAFATG